MTHKKSNKKHGGTRKARRGGGGGKGRHHGQRRMIIHGDDYSESESSSMRSGRQSVRQSLHDLNDMVELSRGEFSSIDEMAINSMTFNRNRPSKADKRKARMAEIADYTGRHYEDTFKKDLRKIPIDFIKAKELYNPSIELYQKLGLTEDGVRVGYDENKEEEEPEEEDSSSIHDKLLERATEMLKEELINCISDFSDEEDEIVSDIPTEAPFIEVESLNQESSDESDEVELVDDNEDDNYTGSLNRDSFNLIDEEGDSDDEDDELSITVGKFSTQLKRDEEGEYYIDLPKSSSRHLPNFGFEEGPAKTLRKPEISLDGEPDYDMGDGKESNTDPEFGLLSEDYVSFDITGVTIDNIRMGADDYVQYHVRSPLLFCFEDHIWVAKEEFKDSLVSKGLPEHRFNAFIAYATKHLHGILPDREDTPDDSRFERLSLSEDEDSEVDEEMLEGIDEMIAFRKNKMKIMDDPVDIGTHSLADHGRGKNRKLDVPENVTDEIRDSLIRQFQAKIDSKRHKRTQRAEKLHGKNGDAADVTSHDSYYLLKKYPYQMRIEDFKVEMEEFLGDDSRNTLRFPPMDSHGCMTLRDMSRAYHFKARKFGKSPECYVVALKTSGSKRVKPDYREVDKLLNRRRVFVRSDSGLTKEERKELRRLMRETDPNSDRKKERKGAFSYKEGDIVGANASEIGPESIGSKLLTKMGWQKGEALGAEGNKGIMVPIQAIVKNTKVGIR
ncbi:DEKNAAC105034 [Brettanomyces naardenensis]|uniref:DEKNAAC105034 n=1 Tax=Brettanomyces naardenensis TaxID=13370 RepID=A0A448YRW9_BRENA|nr:DEKNAAC105034 [Brettanomyces naardenensis]